MKGTSRHNRNDSQFSVDSKGRNREYAKKIRQQSSTKDPSYVEDCIG